MNKENVSAHRRGIYLLPNLFTTATLFGGFYSVVAAMQGDFYLAAAAIFVAMIADGLDGRVARLTQTASEFGAQYDSVADMVAFGVAPALVAYSWAFYTLGKLGWLVAFLYTAAGALRLSRFNIQRDTVDKQYFQGLPIPSAAGAMASVVWLGYVCGFDVAWIRWPLLLLSIMVSLLMVSHVRYHSFKEIDFKGKVPFATILLVILIFVGIAMNPPLVLCVTFVGYVFFGLLFTLLDMRQRIVHIRARRLKRKK